MPLHIDQINIYSLHVPFKRDFSISYETLDGSKPVVVEVLANEGKIKGYGEGLPVKEVTGEKPQTVTQAVASFVAQDAFPSQIENVDQIFSFVESLPEKKEVSAAICSLESALLDAIGRYQKKTITEYFSKDFWTDIIYYGAPIPLSDEETLIQVCAMIKKLGLTHLRVKAGADLEQNEASLRAIRSILAHNCEVRVDPNQAWDIELAYNHLPILEKYDVEVLEEPMPPDTPGFSGFARATLEAGIKLMACESAPTFQEVMRIVEQGLFQMINVKLTRSGGLTRSLKTIQYLRRKGISFQIGCSRGETGILSAAGRALGLLCRDAVYIDGSYDAFLLKENTTSQDVSFGFGGEAGPLPGHGLGVEVDPQQLRKLCFSFHEIPIT
ncbi:MAG: hypothetical protein DRG63_10675 [Deltaproteobacteria bacterium]|nr:MAG: hypothetical protein DRG63_10675 [Deltaproteobacteria bacterium]